MAADSLAALASTSDPNVKMVIHVEAIESPSTPMEVNFTEIEETDWRTPIARYIQHGELPHDNPRSSQVEIHQREILPHKREALQKVYLRTIYEMPRTG